MMTSTVRTTVVAAIAASRMGTLRGRTATGLATRAPSAVRSSCWRSKRRCRSPDAGGAVGVEPGRRYHAHTHSEDGDSTDLMACLLGECSWGGLQLTAPSTVPRIAGEPNCVHRHTLTWPRHPVGPAFVHVAVGQVELEIRPDRDGDRIGGCGAPVQGHGLQAAPTVGHLRSESVYLDSSPHL
jgi:hypothetical protein